MTTTTTSTSEAINVLLMQQIPTVRNIEEAAVLASHFPAVITAGPRLQEVHTFRHPNHIIETFGDVRRGPNSPPADAVHRLLDFADYHDGPILVHCHAGISRSTAIACGILLGRGWDVEETVNTLAAVHPARRPFAPNEAILAIIEDRYDLHNLVTYANERRATDYATMW